MWKSSIQEKQLRAITCFVLLLLGTQVAHSQQCSGKYIRYRAVVCGSGTCSNIRDYIGIIGNKAIRFDADPSTGLVYLIGQTVQYTDKDVPVVRDTVMEQNFLGAKISVSASFNAPTLNLRDIATYFDRSGQAIATISTAIGLQVNNCSTCEITNYEIQIQGAAQKRLSRQLSCDISDSIRY